MATRQTETVRLLSAVEAEASLPAGLRPTRASDADLAAVQNLLASALTAETAAARQALRGRISRVVADTWSFHAVLSVELVTFDDRFLTAD